MTTRWNSHEAVDRRQVVPGAQQEEGEADDDKHTAQVHEGVLGHEPPETGPLEVDWNVLTLGGKHVDREVTGRHGDHGGRWSHRVAATTDR